MDYKQTCLAIFYNFIQFFILKNIGKKKLPLQAVLSMIN